MPTRCATREWLVTNGLGGYASGTVAGVITRRYHGLLDRRAAGAARPHGDAEPRRRARLRFRTAAARRSAAASAPAIRRVHAAAADLVEFRLEAGLPVWRYDVAAASSSRSALLLPHMQNTVHIMYRAVDGAGPVALELRPSVHFRAHEAPVSEPLADAYASRAVGERFEIVPRSGPAAAAHAALRRAAPFTLEGAATSTNVAYPIEESRGYQRAGTLWSPAISASTLARRPATRRWSPRPRRGTRSRALSPRRRSTPSSSGAAGCSARRARRARPASAAELVLAADQFLVTPAGRAEDAARAHAVGRRGAHGDRRLSLVHRLGPRHDDQPRRADARDRPRSARRATSCGRSRTTSATA